MSVLITGGTGKTGRRLAAQLASRGVRARIAARSVANSETTVHFDWQDRTSWDDALAGAEAIYLVPPPGMDASVMIAFVKLAQDRGCRRFVLLSASLLPAGGPGAGQLHLWLKENASEWTVLRPSWFMENFSEGAHRQTIQDEGCIYSAAENGRMPFISAEDIAAAACTALTAPVPLNGDFVLTGPKAISYDEAAAIVSSAIERKVVHVRIGVEDLAERHRSRGLPIALARILAGMDALIAGGAEDRTTQSVETLKGAPSITFADFCARNVVAWQSTN